jgi:hypothetical protein
MASARSAGRFLQEKALAGFHRRLIEKADRFDAHLARH